MGVSLDQIWYLGNGSWGPTSSGTSGWPTSRSNCWSDSIVRSSTSRGITTSTARRRRVTSRFLCTRPFGRDRASGGLLLRRGTRRARGAVPLRSRGPEGALERYARPYTRRRRPISPHRGLLSSGDGAADGPWYARDRRRTQRLPGGNRPAELQRRLLPLPAFTSTGTHTSVTRSGSGRTCSGPFRTSTTTGSRR